MHSYIPVHPISIHRHVCGLKMESDIEKILSEFPELYRTQDGGKVGMPF